jgi:hypothetical protein
MKGLRMRRMVGWRCGDDGNVTGAFILRVVELGSPLGLGLWSRLH